jgi:uncharacterized protein
VRLLGLLLCLFSLSAWAVKVPALRSPVMDEAKILGQAERRDLAELAYEIHTNQGPQITILTVKDLQGYAIEDFSIRVAEAWKLGLKEKGNGLLITIAVQERQMRIEVGEGIEGEITDYEASQYINQILTPAFRERRFHAGLRMVMEDVARKFNLQITGVASRPHLPRQRPRHSPLELMMPVGLVILIIGSVILKQRPGARGLFTAAGTTGAGFLMFPGIGIGALIMMFVFGLALGLIGINNLLYALAASQGRRGGGFGGGGGWSGGGGGFSGGGASGRW